MIGSPRGIAATAVGERYFKAQFRELWPRIDGTKPRNKNQRKSFVSKEKRETLAIKQTREIVIAAKKNKLLP